MNIQSAINKVIDSINLDSDDMQSVMGIIMRGEATPAQIGGFLIGLRMKGETVEEIAAAAMVMREFALKVEVSGKNLVDIVGTGGDGSHTFNISTTSAFVVAAAGGKVAKHNNRSVSSRSGSADVLEKAGIILGLPPEQTAECINKVGVGFMFAPAHHSATKYAAGPRKELGARTIFNLLGPLTNPAMVQNQLLGVYKKELVSPFAEVLQKLGSKHALVVHSEDGMDEISISASTHVAELKQGEILSYNINPEQYGFALGNSADITVDSIEDSLELMLSVLNNDPGTARDIICLNAGAAIYAADLTNDLESGIAKADEVLANGSAAQKLDELIKLTTKFAK